MKKMKPQTIVLIVSGALTAVICGVMNFYLIPAIEITTQGIRCFDMNFGYSFEKATQFLSLLSQEGKNIYLTRQLPLDFVYPVAYGLFFGAAITALLGRKSKWLLLPAFLMLFDYCENVCVILMLKSETLPQALVSVASAATIIKTVLMYLCFLLIIILLIRYFVQKKRKA